MDQSIFNIDDDWYNSSTLLDHELKEQLQNWLTNTVREEELPDAYATTNGLTSSASCPSLTQLASDPGPPPHQFEFSAEGPVPYTTPTAQPFNAQHMHRNCGMSMSFSSSNLSNLDTGHKRKIDSDNYGGSCKYE